MSGEEMSLKKVLEIKANMFYKQELPVHVKFKDDYWKNGYIKKMNSEFFMLDEFVDGMIPVFFLQIKDINKFTREDEND